MSSSGPLGCPPKKYGPGEINLDKALEDFMKRKEFSNPVMVKPDLSDKEKMAYARGILEVALELEDSLGAKLQELVKKALEALK